MKKLSFLALLLLAISFLPGCSDPNYPNYATSEARTYLMNMFPDWTIISIVPVGQDSDGDGYLSITARLEKNGQEKILSLQCASNSSYSGCKMNMPAYNQ